MEQEETENSNEASTEQVAKEEPVASPSTDEVKKRAVMGQGGGAHPAFLTNPRVTGFNLFGGFNPAAVQLRSNSGKSLTTGTDSAEGSPSAASPATSMLVVEQPELAEWIIKHTAASISLPASDGIIQTSLTCCFYLGDDGKRLHDIFILPAGEEARRKVWLEALKDGVVLCKLIKSLYPEKSCKINTGRFPFMVCISLLPFSDGIAHGEYQQFPKECRGGWRCQTVHFPDRRLV